MQAPLIECVPNVSEGRNQIIIDAISQTVQNVTGVTLLDVDPGKAANRTVYTFVGNPDAVVEAAFQLIKKASELIDMSKHTGEHLRFGATDVCPLIPISNITLNEVTSYAHTLGKRVGSELGISGYYYENAATKKERVKLENCRSGEYEGLQNKFSLPDWKPDFGPGIFTEKTKKTGAIAISARNFLIAYNINLDSTSTKIANAIAFDIRESGRMVHSENEPSYRKPGKLKAVKGLGWYIEEYGFAQVSYNLTNINITPTHIAFDETVKVAKQKGVNVRGSELIGLIPIKELLDTADYFLKKENKSTDIPDIEKVQYAVNTLGLDDLKPFDINKKVIEYAIKSAKKGN